MVKYKGRYTAEEIQEIDDVISKAVDDTFPSLKPQAAGQLKTDASLSQHINASVAAIKRVKDIGEVDKNKLPAIERDLRMAIARFPESIDLHGQLSSCLIRQGKKDESVDHMRNLASKHPDDPEFHVAYIFALVSSGQPKRHIRNEAEKVFRMGLSNDQKVSLNQILGLG